MAAERFGHHDDVGVARVDGDLRDVLVVHAGVDLAGAVVVRLYVDDGQAEFDHGA